MIKKAIVIYIIIGSLQVYNLAVLANIVKLIQISAIALMVAIILLNLVYSRNKMRVHQRFRLPIILIAIAVIMSMFMAYFAFNQNFAISLYAQRDIYFYLVYFTLHVLHIEKKELQRLIIFFGLLYFVLYLVQFFAFPTELFDIGMREERGTIRIYLEGSGYAMISYFMCLQIFYSTNKFKYLLLAIVFFIPIILFGARSGISTMLLGTIVQLILSKRVKSRALIVFLVLLAIVPTIYLFQDVFAGVLTAQKIESAQGSENIRIVAAQYFMLEFMPNDLAYITGIGAPSDRSSLGQMTTLLSKRYGFYLVDIGLIGNLVTYGALFVFSVLWMVFKTLTTKVTDDMAFIKFFFFFEVLLMLPIAAGFAFSPPIATLCCIFYLVDVSAHERKQTDPGSTQVTVEDQIIVRPDQIVP
jgi:hypothetical protein